MKKYILPALIGCLFAGLIYFFAYPAFFVLVCFVGWIGLIKLLNYKALLFPSPIRHLIRWLHAMTFEALLFVACLLLRPFGYLQNQKKFIGTSSGRPILLIHGYLHDSSAWAYIRQKLSSEGFGPIYTLNLIHPFRSIRSYGEFVHEKAQKIALETGRKDLILVGHSMGGLVGCWYATKIAKPGTVTDIITIGSPLCGTYAAYVAIGPNGREMQPDSAFVRELQKEISQNKIIRFYHIGTKTDQLVIPNSSCWIGNDLKRQLIVDDIGHVSLLFSSRILKKICEWLKNIN